VEHGKASLGHAQPGRVQAFTLFFTRLLVVPNHAASVPAFSGTSQEKADEGTGSAATLGFGFVPKASVPGLSVTRVAGSVLALSLWDKWRGRNLDLPARRRQVRVAGTWGYKRRGNDGGHIRPQTTGAKTMSAAAAVSSANFDTEVLQSDVPVLVDFWRLVRSVQAHRTRLDAVAEQMTGKAKIVKVNVDEEPDLSGRYGIQSIPALLIFKEGKVVEQMAGMMPRQAIAEKLNAHL
jgi:thioredoxin 1